MRVAGRWRCLSVAVLAASLVGAGSWGHAGAQDAPAGTPVATPRADLASPRTGEAPSPSPRDVVRAAYNLMRQRYVVEVSPAALLAAARGAEASVDPALSGAGGSSAEEAWAGFIEEFSSVAHVPAAGMNPAHVAVRRMTASLNDCHTSFTDDHGRDAVALSRVEPYGGVGAVIREARRFDPAPPGPVVVQVFDGSPAAGAGLRAGDAVIAVDGALTADASRPLVERVRGVPGTTVVLRVDRLGEETLVEVPVVRGEVTVPLVAWRVEMVAGVGPVGVLRLRSFARPAVTPFTEAVAAMRSKGVRGWVIDLRDNGGGDLGVFQQVASLFIDGPLAITIKRDGAPRVIARARAPGPDDAASVDRLPVAVLAGADTASAAELLAGDLFDYGVGRLFGERTAGCFGTSELFRLPDGSGMWITVSALQTGLARRDVHRTGMTPAVAVPLRRADLAAGRDAVAEAAFSWLQQRLARTGGDPRTAMPR